MAQPQIAGRFAAPETADLETVRDKLRSAEAGLAQAEATAPQAALRVALGKPEEGDAEIVARLPLLRAGADTLRMAVAAAEQQEADRIAEKRYQADAAARR